eukprot:m.105769 g.105769  ORF g.105769 m.105769 type:complete len:463 (+) comp37232_c0_seq38:785-2173(+)
MFGGDEKDGKVYELIIKGKEKGEWVEIKVTRTKGEINPGARFGAAMIEIDEHRALLHGGVSKQKSFYGNFFVLDLAKKTWTKIEFDQLQLRRGHHKLCRLGNLAKRRFLCFGGEGEKRFDYILEFDDRKAVEVKPKSVCQHTAHCIEESDGTAKVFCLGGRDCQTLKPLLTTFYPAPRNIPSPNKVWKTIKELFRPPSFPASTSPPKPSMLAAAQSSNGMQVELIKKDNLLKKNEAKRKSMTYELEQLGNKNKEKDILLKEKTAEIERLGRENAELTEKYQRLEYTTDACPDCSHKKSQINSLQTKTETPGSPLLALKRKIVSFVSPRKADTKDGKEAFSFREENTVSKKPGKEEVKTLTPEKLRSAEEMSLDILIPLVCKCGSHKWKEIGIFLNFTSPELKNVEGNIIGSNFLRLQDLLDEYKCDKGDTVETRREVLNAARKVKIGGVLKEELNKKGYTMI